MTTTNLNLNTYNHGVDDDESFQKYRTDLDGTTDSNMTLIDDWAGLFALSVLTLATNTSVSMTPINALLGSISGSIVNSRSASSIISGCFVRLDTFSGSGQPDFSGISSSYTHLLLMGRGYLTYGGGPPAFVTNLGIDFNGDSGSSNYFSIIWKNSGSSGSYTETCATDSSSGAIFVGQTYTNSSFPINLPIFVLIPNYSSSSGFYKIAMGFSVGGSGEGLLEAGAALQGGTWLSTNAINRIRLFGYTASAKQDFNESEFSLYGFI